PVQGRVPLRGVNFVGDDQADRRNHGGRDKAVYSYAREDQEWWEEQLGRPIERGGFGENLTLSSVDVTGAVIGERWEIGSALLEVAQPRSPCWKLGARMGDPDFPPRFADACRPGAYLRIIKEGDVGAGDEVRVVYRPTGSISVSEIARIYSADKGKAHLLLEVPGLAESWKSWARRVVKYRE
ncbi:MAG: MOSC domain-containing protein, partial [Chloroflexota bacterium]|nr:MOSC domain-containing protein [Chloroflexota bacterium]